MQNAAPDSQPTIVRLAAPVLSIIGGITVALLVGGDLSTPVAVLILGAIGAIIMATLVVGHFELFVVSLLFIRSALDITKSADERTITDPSSAVALLFLAGGAAWLIARSYAGRERSSGPMPSIIALFALGAGLSTISSMNPSLSAEFTVRLFAGLMMFFVVQRLIADGADPKRFLKAVMAAAIIPIFAQALTFVTPLELTEIKDGVERMRATFFSSNALAHFLLVVTMLGLGLYRHMKGRDLLFVGFVTIGSGLLMLMTLTLSAWVGLAVGGLVIGAIQYRRYLLLVPLVVVAILLVVPGATERLQGIGDDPTAPREQSSFAWRFAYWDEIIDLNHDNLATGIGFGVTASITEQEKEPHNDYLRSYVEMGIFGIVMFVSLVAAMIRTGWVALQKTHHSSGWARGTAVGFFGYAVAFSVVSFAENIYAQVVVLWYIMAVAAVAHAIATGRWSDAPKLVALESREIPFRTIPIETTP